MKTIWICLLVNLILSAGACRKASEPVSERAAQVLVYSKTLGFRHECIEPGTEAMQAFFRPYRLEMTVTEDSTWFRPEKLEAFDAVMFFQTSGDVLDSLGEHALQAFVQAGKGFVGIHAAADTEYDWPWYGKLVGAYFASHSEIQDAVVEVRDTAHASCRHLPDRWPRRDEWYNFRTLPDSVQVLLAVDEATFQGGAHPADHPIAWYHYYDGGRSFYTALGHTVESYRDSLFLQHVLGGVQWAVGEDLR